MLSQLDQHLKEGISVLSSDKIHVFGTVGDIRFIFVLREVLLEEVHFSFIVVNQESDDVVQTDETLYLRLLVGGEHYQVQVLLIDNLHCV